MWMEISSQANIYLLCLIQSGIRVGHNFSSPPFKNWNDTIDCINKNQKF